MATENNIIAQTTAKVAAELAASTQPRTIEDAIAAYDKAFVHVLNSIFNASSKKEERKTKGGRQVPILSQEEIQAKLNLKLQSGSSVSTSSFNI